MFLCPRCHKSLVRSRGPKGAFWVCPGCQGRGTTVPVLRKHLPAEAVSHLWMKAREPGSSRALACPACNRNMAAIAATGKTGGQVLDVCTRCHFAWFDAHEFEALAAEPQPQPQEPGLSPAARTRMAEILVQHSRENAYASPIGQESPDEFWKFIPGLLGMPIEYETQWFKRYPLVTWGLALLIAAVSTAAFFDLDNVVASLGLVPTHPFRYGGLTFISSFLLHGGIFHLLSNLYFFLVFGDNVEDVLGHGRFFLLVCCATLTGGMLHILADPHSTTPCVGASGGISGVLVYYGLRFPHAHLGVMLRVFFFFRFIRLPAWFLLVLWLGLQFLGGYLQLNEATSVSAFAHLGGALAGAAFWLATRRS